MANSSDWLAALSREAQPQANGWLEQLPATATFVEGAPFALRDAAVPEPDPVPAADPMAEAFERGMEAGREAAEREQSVLDQHQRALRVTLRGFDQAAMDSLAAELAETVIALCSKAVEDFAADHERLLARCSDAARRLGAVPDDCALHLHPADIALIDPGSLAQWRVVADETIARGGLRFEGRDGSVSDGPVEWRRAIASAIRG